MQKEKRTWGVAVEGIALSAAANTTQPNYDDPLRIEVALRNTGMEPKTFLVGAWIEFFTLTILKPDGSKALLTAFGQQQIEAARGQAGREIVVQPEQVIDADIPAGALYDLRQSGVYRITGKCVQSSAISNQIQIRI